MAQAMKLQGFGYNFIAARISYVHRYYRIAGGISDVSPVNVAHYPSMYLYGESRLIYTVLELEFV